MGGGALFGFADFHCTVFGHPAFGDADISAGDEDVDRFRAMFDPPGDGSGGGKFDVVWVGVDDEDTFGDIKMIVCHSSPGFA